jgi:cytochrome P450
VRDVGRPADAMHVAFGFGEHFRLGGSLARLEARVLFEELLNRFPEFSLAGEILPLRSTPHEWPRPHARHLPQTLIRR